VAENSFNLAEIIFLDVMAVCELSWCKNIFRKIQSVNINSRKADKRFVINRDNVNKAVYIFTKALVPDSVYVILHS